MGTVRPMIRFAAAVLPAVLALGGPATASAAPPTAPAGPPHAWIVGAGRSLATPSGHPLFPTLAGRPVAGWLGAFGGEAMATAWGGYHQRHPLGPGLEADVVRAEGLLAAYLIRRSPAGEVCLGHVIHEPRALPDPDGADRALRKAGFTARRGFLATPGAHFAVDAGTFERRAAGHVERYLFVRLPSQGAAPPPLYLAEAAFYPVAHEAGLGSWVAEGRERLAAFLAARSSPAAPDPGPL